ncbi:hypothetical protein HDU76_001404 [Blyttiomyces sp. JEL0837]|nr:hypothetical protein HDU76_001404 [Blyttiomyces sp. JEL0837]
MSSAATLPLHGLKVLELAGLAPGPFCGMILSDFGADVIRVDKTNDGTTDVLARGKRSVSLNLKSPKGREILLKLMSQVDVVIDPFRPGVLERMGLGPDKVLKVNPRCIYARLTGFGQTGTGPYAKMAGHDINYIAISGALNLLGRKDESPMFPANILGDFAGGGMLCAMGILIALYERQKSGLGQVIDSAMIDGASYLSSFIVKMKQNGVWNEPRGENLLDSGAHFYETYKTKDGKYMAVGAIEPQFYAALLKGLELDPSTLPDQLDTSNWASQKQHFIKIFASKTQSEWRAIFDGTDACVTPILDFDEVMKLDHNRDRGFMVKPAEAGNDGKGDAGISDGYEPRPAPRLSRTPGRHIKVREAGDPEVGQHTVMVLKEFGVGEEEIRGLLGERVVMQQGDVKAKL